MAHTGVDAEPVNLIEACLVSAPGGEQYLDLRSSLEPHLAALLTRHKDAAAKADWSCHQFLPFEAFRAHPRRHRPLSRAAYTAVEMALLTEVNLPWYTAGLSHGLRRCPAPIQEFVRVWTSEEDQHATLLETYLLLSGNGDPAARARARKAVITAGWTHQLGSPFEGMVYTAIQEAVTRTFYLCTARACEPDDSGLAEALRRIAKRREGKTRAAPWSSCESTARSCASSRVAATDSTPGLSPRAPRGPSRPPGSPPLPNAGPFHCAPRNFAPRVPEGLQQPTRRVEGGEGGGDCPPHAAPVRGLLLGVHVNSPSQVIMERPARFAVAWVKLRID